MSQPTSLPWYCVNVGGRIIDIIDPSLPCAAAQNVSTQIGAAASSAGGVLQQLQGLATDFTWLQGNWARLMIALVAIVIIGIGFWVLASGG